MTRATAALAPQAPCHRVHEEAARHREKMIGAARRRGAGPDSADVAHDVLVSIFEGSRAFDPRQNAESFLMTGAGWGARRYRASASRLLRSEPIALELIVGDEGFEGAAQLAEDLRRLSEIANTKLSPKLRAVWTVTVLLMLEQGGRPPREQVAALLGISPEAAATSMNRAREAIRAHF